jgi:phosphatidate cytidylyltransferase
MALVSALALYEYYGLARSKGIRPQVGVGLVFGLSINCVFFFNTLQYFILKLSSAFGLAVPLPTMLQVLLILMLVILPLVLLLELFRNIGSAITNVATTLFGVCYVSLFLGSFIGLRELFVPGDFPFYRYFDVQGVAVPDEIAKTVYSWGGYTVSAVLASIWVCDTAAYFAGRAFGKRKMFERVSPNKTWEGAITGLVFAVITFVMAQQLLLPYLSLTSALICGAIIGLFGQLGDMVESLLKRDAGLKDSSAFIPGHGGVLDRFDSLILVAPIIFFYFDFVIF